MHTIYHNYVIIYTYHVINSENNNCHYNNNINIYKLIYSRRSFTYYKNRITRPHHGHCTQQKNL